MSISKVEEIFLKQNSRNQRLDLGDQNNFFFQRIVKVRNSKNLIKHLWDEDGFRAEERDQIKNVAEDFFRKLLGSSSNQFNGQKPGRLEQL